MVQHCGFEIINGKSTMLLLLSVFRKLKKTLPIGLTSFENDRFLCFKFGASSTLCREICIFHVPTVKFYRYNWGKWYLRILFDKWRERYHWYNDFNQYILGFETHGFLEQLYPCFLKPHGYIKTHSEISWFYKLFRLFDIVEMRIFLLCYETMSGLWGFLTDLKNRYKTAR